MAEVASHETAFLIGASSSCGMLGFNVFPNALGKYKAGRFKPERISANELLAAAISTDANPQFMLLAGPLDGVTNDAQSSRDRTTKHFPGIKIVTRGGKQPSTV